MATKQWNVGDVLTASDMNVWTVPIATIKPADTGRNTTTTLTADPDLVIAVAANTIYDVRFLIRYKGGTNGSSDLSMQINVPSGSTGFWVALRDDISAPTGPPGFVDSAFGSALNFATNGTGNTQQALLFASVNTAGTAGNISLLWAQHISNGTNTTLMANSFMVAQRIG